MLKKNHISIQNSILYIDHRFFVVVVDFFLFSFINSDHESFILVYWQFHSSQVFFFIQMVKKRFFFCIFFWIQNSNRDYYDPNSMYIESHFTHTRIISVTFNSREKKEKNFVFFSTNQSFNFWRQQWNSKKWIQNIQTMTEAMMMMMKFCRFEWMNIMSPMAGWLAGWLGEEKIFSRQRHGENADRQFIISLVS